MSLSGLAVSRPVTTTMFFVSLLVLGAISLARLPLAFLPEVDIPFIWIEIPYPGANPTQIEKTIIKPLEESLSTMPGIRKIESYISADEAWIQIEFDWGESLEMVRMETDAKIAGVRPSLPGDLPQMLVYSFSTSDIPIVWGRLSAPGRDLSESYDLIEKRIKNRLERVKGVAKVDIAGVSPKEVRIHLRLDEIMAHNVDVSRLIERIDRASAGESLGEIRQAGQKLAVRTEPLMDAVESVGKLRIGQKDLTVDDIAWITYREPPLDVGRHLNRDFAIALEVFKESTANTVEVATEVKRVIRDEIGTDPLLRGIQLFVWQDQAEEITNGLRGLRRAGLWGALFAVGVLFAFLRRPGATLIVSSAIPISIIASCVCLYLLGKNLNVLSMMGLMLGVGMLVDNSIVVFESIFRRHTRGVEAFAAAVGGAREVEMAVVAATMTTVIVFLPLLVGSRSEIATWLGEIGLAITLTLLCSLLVSLTLIPFLSSRLMRARRQETSRFFDWLTGRYTSVLAWTFRHKVIMALLIIVLVPVLIAMPFKLGLDTETFAGGKNNRMALTYELLDFTYLGDAEKVVDQVEAYLMAHKDDFLIDTVYSWFADNRAETYLTLTTDELSDKEYKTLMKRIRQGMPTIPGVLVRFDEQEEDDRSRHFTVRYYGDDPDTLDRLAERAVSVIAKRPGMEDVRVDRRNAHEEIEAAVDRERAQEAGLSPMAVARILGFSLGGTRMRRLATAEREVEVICGLQYEDREHIGDLRALAVGGAEGRRVPLGSIVDFRVKRRPSEIHREGRRRTIAIKATYEGEKFGEARKALQETMDGLPLPLGYAWSWGGGIEEQDKEARNMQVNLLLALVLVYIVIASLFESFSHPFAIIFSIPFGLVGVVWLLLVTATPLNIMAQIGFLILMGIVVNNGIVLIDKINRHRREGLGREEAILRGGSARLRPILMTTFTTVLGLLPMAVGSTGLGNAYYYPLARTIIGGLLVSSLLTLVALPQVYAFFDAAGTRLRRIVTLSA